MRPLTVFKASRERAEYLLSLHELLENRRRRRIRADWAKKFKRIMNWRQSERIERVDGHHAVLILRQETKIPLTRFHDGHLDELLRAALTCIVAALDRYCHELILSRIVPALNRPEKKWHRRLKGLQLPMTLVKATLRHSRSNRSRPMNLVREGIRGVLHRETFQSPDEIARAMSMIGVSNLWRKVLSQNSDLADRAEDICKRLDRIVHRRNLIVHEGDILRKKRGGRIEFGIARREEVSNDVQWVSDLVNAIDAVVFEGEHARSGASIRTTRALVGSASR